MPKITGVARGSVRGYAVFRERGCDWLTSDKGEAEWSMDKMRAHWFNSIDDALRRVRRAGIDMGSIQVIPVRAI